MMLQQLRSRKTPR